LNTDHQSVHSFEDKIDEEIQVPTDDAAEFTERNGFLCFSTSAKTGEGVDEVINKITREIMASRSIKNEKPPKPIVRKGDNCAC
jgi:translation elongation factor EF-4